MPDVTLAIYEPDRSWEAPLKPEGTVVGRSANCDIVIDSKGISRQHLRIFQDPFDRWILEDLCSSNGTFVNGKHIDVHPISPGETAIIGLVSLSVNQVLEPHIERDDAVESANIMIKDFETEVLYPKGAPDDPSIRPCPAQLDEIRRRLSEITSLSVLYPEVCRTLARAPGTVAAILRVPAKDVPLPKMPEVLGLHFGTSLDNTVRIAAIHQHPSYLAFRFSRRVLDAVRTSGEPVMSKSIYSSDVEVTITSVDEHSPRAVICASLGQAGDCVDLLYLDVPIDRGLKAGPDEVFAFGRVVASEIASARETLVPIHVKSERNALDRELWLAQQIQKRLVPRIPTDLGAFEAAVVYRPVIWVGGDFCDLWALDDGRLVFAMGHILDKGLHAATTISTLGTLLRSTMSFSDELSDIVNHVNKHLMASCSERISGTLLLGLLDRSTGTVRYVNACHPEPLMLHPTSGVRVLGNPGDVMIGGEKLNLQTSVETIDAGCALVIFSQGVVDACSPKQEQFGVKRLMHILKDSHGQSAVQIADSVIKAVDDFRESVAQQDDLSLLILGRSAEGR